MLSGKHCPWNFTYTLTPLIRRAPKDGGQGLPGVRDGGSGATSVTIKGDLCGEKALYLDCGRSYMNIHVIKFHRINTTSMCVHAHMHTRWGHREQLLDRGLHIPSG